MDLLSASCPYNGLTSDLEVDITTRDFCKQAKLTPESADWHGFYTAPDHFHPSWTLFPLFSRAKISVFNDILAPNVCYGHTDYRVWGENDTIPFNTKQKDIYWRGSMTGMQMTPTNWYHGQRHRLVRYVQSMREYITGIQEGNKTSIFEPSFSQAPWNSDVKHALSRLSAKSLNIGFSGFGRGNSAKICDPIKEELPLMSRDLPKEIFNHQFVVDVDGQSMSCRFYSLLESNSVVLKQTIWGEWHDDRLVPWLHYVPIDIDVMQHEIPLYIDWFIHAPEGQRYADIIASESRQWTGKSLRSIDITIYFFRLLIELNDIMF